MRAAGRLTHGSTECRQNRVSECRVVYFRGYGETVSFAALYGVAIRFDWFSKLVHRKNQWLAGFAFKCNKHELLPPPAICAE